jgi:hypothetical protein
MATQAILTCPNCGASITNTQNCEFCGSLLIRLQQQGINIEQAGYKDDSKIFKGLTGALKRNLDLQKATNYELSVVTDIFRNNNEGVCSILKALELPDGQSFFPDKLADGKGHLMVAFGFMPDNISGDELLLRKFRNLDIYELFTEVICFDEYNRKNYEYAIDFDLDVEGAARLTSKVLHEVYSIPYEEILECHTNSGNEIEKDRAIMNGESWNQEGETNQGEENTWAWWVYVFVLGIGLLIFLFQTC